MKRRPKDQLTISAVFEAARKRSRGGEPTQEVVDSGRVSSHPMKTTKFVFYQKPEKDYSSDFGEPANTFLLDNDLVEDTWVQGHWARQLNDVQGSLQF